MQGIIRGDDDIHAATSDHLLCAATVAQMTADSCCVYRSIARMHTTHFPTDTQCTQHTYKAAKRKLLREFSHRELERADTRRSRIY